MRKSENNPLRQAAQSTKRELLFVNLAVIILGLLMVIFPENSTLFMCKAVGVALCAWGLFHVVNYFLHSSMEVFGSFGLVVGAALLGFGAYFLMHPEFLASIFTVALGIVLLVGGATKLQYAMDFLRLQTSNWWMQLVAAGVTVVLGIVALVNPFQTASALTLFLGVSFLVNGIWDIGAVLSLCRFLNMVEKAADQADNVIDVTFTEDP